MQSRAGRRTWPSLRWGICLTGAVSVLALSLASAAASADPLGEVVAKVLPPTPVTGPAGIPPEPTTSSVPPLPVQVPTPTPTSPPAKPPAAVPAPIRASAAPTPSPPRAVGAVAGATGESASSVADLPANLGSKPVSPSGRADGRADGPAPATPGPSTRSVEPAKRSPLGRWLPHVWPAVALGPVGRLLTALQGKGTAASLSREKAARSLPGLTAGVAGGVAGESAHSSSVPSASDARASLLPGGAEISLFILVVASGVLMTVLVFAVKTELGPFSYWPH